MDTKQYSDSKLKDWFNKHSYKLGFIFCLIGQICIATTCMILYINDEVIPGEGQDPIINWLYLGATGILGCSVIGIVCIYEHLKINKGDATGWQIFVTFILSAGLTIMCGILALKTMETYGPGLDEQTYFVEEADFRITFPKGLSLIEETKEDESSYTLYAFDKFKSIYVHIYLGWDRDNWTDNEFKKYMTKQHKQTFSKEIHYPSQFVHFDHFNALRIVGKAPGDDFGQFRVYYDILRNGTFIRVAIITDNLSGKPDDSHIKSWEDIVRSIEFTDYH